MAANRGKENQGTENKTKEKKYIRIVKADEIKGSVVFNDPKRESPDFYECIKIEGDINNANITSDYQLEIVGSVNNSTIKSNVSVFVHQHVNESDIRCKYAATVIGNVDGKEANKTIIVGKNGIYVKGNVGHDCVLDGKKIQVDGNAGKNSILTAATILPIVKGKNEAECLLTVAPTIQPVSMVGSEQKRKANEVTENDDGTRESGTKRQDIQNKQFTPQATTQTQLANTNNKRKSDELKNLTDPVSKPQDIKPANTQVRSDSVTREGTASSYKRVSAKPSTTQASKPVSAINTVKPPEIMTPGSFTPRKGAKPLQNRTVDAMQRPNPGKEEVVDAPPPPPHARPTNFDTRNRSTVSPQAEGTGSNNKRARSNMISDEALAQTLQEMPQQYNEATQSALANLKLNLQQIELEHGNFHVNSSEGEKTINLRPYQVERLKQYSEAMVHNDQAHKHAVFELPTGTGKTVIFSSLISNMFPKNATQENSLQVLILVSRTELVKQTKKKLKEIAPHLNIAQLNQDGEGKVKNAHVVITTYQTFDRERNRKILFPDDPNECRPSFVVLDEAHNALSENKTAIFKSLAQQTNISAWTATPEYSNPSKKGLTNVYQLFEDEPSKNPIQPITLLEAINLGALAPVRACVVKMELQEGFKLRKYEKKENKENSPSNAANQSGEQNTGIENSGQNSVNGSAEQGREDELSPNSDQNISNANPLDLESMNEEELERYLNAPKYNLAALKLYCTTKDPKNGQPFFGKYGMIFCAGTAHTKEMTKTFNEHLKIGEHPLLRKIKANYLRKMKVEHEKQREKYRTKYTPEYVKQKSKGSQWKTKKDFYLLDFDDILRNVENNTIPTTHEGKYIGKLYDLYKFEIAAGIYAEQDNQYSKIKLKKFKSGGILIAIGNKMLTEGFDAPAVSVELNWSGRRSKLDRKQELGRALRLDANNPNKIAYSIDLDLGIDNQAYASECLEDNYEAGNLDVIDRRISDNPNPDAALIGISITKFSDPEMFADAAIVTDVNWEKQSGGLYTHTTQARHPSASNKESRLASRKKTISDLGDALNKAMDKIESTLEISKTLILDEAPTLKKESVQTKKTSEESDPKKAKSKQPSKQHTASTTPAADDDDDEDSILERELIDDIKALTKRSKILTDYVDKIFEGIEYKEDDNEDYIPSSGEDSDEEENQDDRAPQKKRKKETKLIKEKTTLPSASTPQSESKENLAEIVKNVSGLKRKLTTLIDAMRGVGSHHVNRNNNNNTVSEAARDEAYKQIEKQYEEALKVMREMSDIFNQGTIANISNQIKRAREERNTPVNSVGTTARDTQPPQSTPTIQQTQPDQGPQPQQVPAQGSSHSPTKEDGGFRLTDDDWLVDEPPVAENIPTIPPVAESIPTIPPAPTMPIQDLTTEEDEEDPQRLTAKRAFKPMLLKLGIDKIVRRDNYYMIVMLPSPAVRFHSPNVEATQSNAVNLVNNGYFLSSKNPKLKVTSSKIGQSEGLFIRNTDLPGTLIGTIIREGERLQLVEDGTPHVEGKKINHVENGMELSIGWGPLISMIYDFDDYYAIKFRDNRTLQDAENCKMFNNASQAPIGFAADNFYVVPKVKINKQVSVLIQDSQKKLKKIVDSEPLPPEISDFEHKLAISMPMGNFNSVCQVQLQQYLAAKPHQQQPQLGQVQKQPQLFQKQNVVNKNTQQEPVAQKTAKQPENTHKNKKQPATVQAAAQYSVLQQQLDILQKRQSDIQNRLLMIEENQSKPVVISHNVMSEIFQTLRQEITTNVKPDQYEMLKQKQAEMIKQHEDKVKQERMREAVSQRVMLSPILKEVEAQIKVQQEKIVSLEKQYPELLQQMQATAKQPTLFTPTEGPVPKSQTPQGAPRQSSASDPNKPIYKKQ